MAAVDDHRALCLSGGFITSYCQKDRRADEIVCLDPSGKCLFDVQDSGQARLVVPALFGAIGKYSHRDHRLDGDSQGSREGGLVGDIDNIHNKQYDH